MKYHNFECIVKIELIKILVIFFLSLWAKMLENL